MKLNYLKNKVAVVTGAAQGIGFAISEKLASLGMRVVLADIEEKLLAQATQTLNNKGYEAIGIVTDVSNPDAVRSLADQTLEKFGRIHLLCNNAGIPGVTQGKLWEHSHEQWQRVINTNLMGVVNGIHAFLPALLAQNEPAIVINTASELGLMSMPEIPIYTSTKHAIVNLTEALYYQLQQIDSVVRVILLCPGLTNTNIIKAGVMTENAADEIKKVSAKAVEPGFVADELVKAIERDQFYCITTDLVDTAIKRRFDDILNRQNPELNPVGSYCGVCGSERTENCSICAS